MIDLVYAPGGTNNFQKVIFCQNIYYDLSVAQPYSLRSSASHQQIQAKPQLCQEHFYVTVFYDYVTVFISLCD